MIRPETYKGFQEAVKEEYGVLLAEGETKEILDGLVGYFGTLAEIDAKIKTDTKPQTSPSPETPAQLSP